MTGPDAPPGGQTPSSAGHAGADPRTLLAAAAGRVAAALPALLPEVLALPRFAAGADALARLTDPAWREAGAAACTDGESARLVAVLAERWAALAGAVPGAGPSAPDDERGDDGDGDPER